MRVLTYLGWYVVVKVPGVLRIVKFWTEWRGITINVGPINSTEERMCLKIYVRRIRKQKRPPAA